jgi:hypothetical protein
MYDQRKQALAARARDIKARLDQIKGRAYFSNRDLTFSERQEVNELKAEAERSTTKSGTFTPTRR